MKRLPLHKKDGEVCGHALVDDADWPALEARSWCVSSHGYVKSRWRYLHREILGLTHGDGLEADHINGDKLDNRRCNLRVVTHAENLQNRGAQRNAQSRHRGVHWSVSNNGWVAQVTVEGCKHHLGTFASEDEAAAAARAFRRQRMPFSPEASAA